MGGVCSSALCCVHVCILGRQITLTVWGDRAMSMNDSIVGKVVAFKGLRVGDFSGKSLSTMNSSGVEEEPNLPEVRAQLVCAQGDPRLQSRRIPGSFAVF